MFATAERVGFSLAGGGSLYFFPRRELAGFGMAFGSGVHFYRTVMSVNSAPGP